MREIFRAKRFEEANPRPTEEQQADAFKAWYEARRREPTLIFVDRATAQAGVNHTNPEVIVPRDPRQDPQLGAPIATLPLVSAPGPRRISLTLNALPQLDTDQPILRENISQQEASGPHSARSDPSFQSPPLRMGPKQIPTAEVRELVTVSIQASLRKVDPSPPQGSQRAKPGKPTDDYESANSPEAARMEEQVRLMPAPPAPLRWGDEWPQPLVSPPIRTTFFKRILDWEVESEEVCGHQADC